MSNLGLNNQERAVLIRMLGPRYIVGSQIVRLVSTRFPNRLENRKYNIMLLEQLLAEARRICVDHADEFAKTTLRVRPAQPSSV